MSKGENLISIVVPIYNEEDVIDEFYKRTKGVLTSLSSGYKHEMIFINDGSTDKSLEILKELAEKDNEVKIISFSRNFGHQSAITAGIDHSNGDAVVVIDADLQDPPEVIPDMVSKWEKGYKVVYGVRVKRRGVNVIKTASYSIFYRLISMLSETKLPLYAGDFRLMDRVVAQTLTGLPEGNRYIRGLVTWVGFLQCGLPYTRDSRYAGKSKYTRRKLFKLAFDGITSFSERPLYIASYFGIAITILSLIFAIWSLINKIVNPEFVVAGWTSLVIIILFLGGVQLLFLGLIGQYLGRIYIETKRRPHYIVETKYGFGDTPKERLVKTDKDEVSTG